MVSFGFVSQWLRFALVSFGFVSRWFRFAKYSKPVDKRFETNEGKHNNATRSPKPLQKDLLLLQLILIRNLDFLKVRDMLFV